MGAELLRNQDPVSYFDNHHSRFMWGLLHFLDFDRHRHKRKMIPHKRNTDENDGGGAKILTSGQSDDSSDRERLLNKEANFQTENRGADKKRSGSAHLITLLYKKLTRRKDRKMKDSPSAARLLRTISIHHLECDDYVLPDDSTVEKKSDFSASSEQASGTEKCLQDLEQEIESMVKEEHRISMDGVMDKIPVGHKLPDDDTEKEKVSSRGDGPRSMFGSEGFVSANSKLAHRSIWRSRSLTESLEMHSSLFESGSVREPQRLPQRLNSVKERGSNSAHRRFLRSHSLSESLDKYSHLLEFISVREPPRLHHRSRSINEQANRFAHGRALKSRSLSESFDRYHLLESISVKEPRRLPQRSNSAREQGNSFAHGRVLRSRSLSESFDKEPQKLFQRLNSVDEQGSRFAHKSVVRSRSLSGYFDRYPNLLEPFPVREPKRQPEGLKSIREEGSSQDTKTQITSGFSNPEAGLFSFSDDVPGEAMAPSPKKPDSSLLADDAEADACTSNESNEPDSAGFLVKTEESMETDTFVQHDAEISSSLEQPEFTTEHDQSKLCTVSEDQTTDDSRAHTEDEGETETNKDASDDPQNPSPVCVLDSYLDDDTIGPAQYAESQGSELKSGWIHSMEQDSTIVNAENKLVDDDSRTTHDRVEDGAEFSFVRNVLRKCGFGCGAEEFLAAWSSSYDPVDQLLFVEEPETMTDDSRDMHLDHQLLFDLTNEILLEIYGSSIAKSIGLWRYNPRARPTPMGDHLLEEVWAKASWHLCSQQDTNHAIQHVEARDYAKNDGWMSLQGDVERVGCYLEGLILDSLVEEAIFDFVDV